MLLYVLFPLATFKADHQVYFKDADVGPDPAKLYAPGPNIWEFSKLVDWDFRHLGEICFA